MSIKDHFMRVSNKSTLERKGHQRAPKIGTLHLSPSGS